MKKFLSVFLILFIGFAAFAQSNYVNFNIPMDIAVGRAESDDYDFTDVTGTFQAEIEYQHEFESGFMIGAKIGFESMAQINQTVINNVDVEADYTGTGTNFAPEIGYIEHRGKYLTQIVLLPIVFERIDYSKLEMLYDGKGTSYNIDETENKRSTVLRINWEWGEGTLRNGFFFDCFMTYFNSGFDSEYTFGMGAGYKLMLAF